VSCAPTLDLTSDGPIDLRLGCRRPAGSSVAGRRCSRRVTVRLPRVRGMRVVRVIVAWRGHRVQRVRGHALRTVRIRRRTRGAFRVRLTLRLHGRHGTTRRIVVTRPIAPCR
jgi:hypothetical protein